MTHGFSVVLHRLDDNGFTVHLVKDGAPTQTFIHFQPPVTLGKIVSQMSWWRRYQLFDQAAQSDLSRSVKRQWDELQKVDKTVLN